MNYIKHLTGFFHRINGENRLNPTHISLYLALFQCWNLNRFNNPTAISRDEVMKASKINSKVTYHKCINELQTLGFIEYVPSFNPHIGSTVNMMNLSELLKPKSKIEQPTSTNFDQYSVLVTGQVNGQVDVQGYIDKHIQTKTNISNIDISPGHSKIPDHFLNFDLPRRSHEEEKKSCAKKKEKQLFVIPDLEAVDKFFKRLKAPSVEADKFFNYYSSKGWLVGDNSQMKDWQAAARNWILNIDKFTKNTPQLSPGNLSSAHAKNYAEPL